MDLEGEVVLSWVCPTAYCINSWQPNGFLVPPLDGLYLSMYLAFSYFTYLYFEIRYFLINLNEGVYSLGMRTLLVTWHANIALITMPFLF